MRKTKWMVSVRLGKQRRDFIIESRPNENPQDTYRRAKLKAEAMKEKTKGQAMVDLISLTVAFKPKGKKPHKRWYWCPYCNKWRVFLFDDYTGYNRCSICRISDQDFYVKKYNGIWQKEWMDERRTRL